VINLKTLQKIFACPRCKSTINTSLPRGKCAKCGFGFKKEGRIWNFLYIPKRNQASHALFENLHQELSGGPNDGSYEILATFARGNKALDIACGEGHIEKLAPETVGVDFSLNALKKAKRAGAKYLVLANSEALPFKNDSFDLSIVAGSLEHFPNPQKAVSEMARVSTIQVLTVHRPLPLPLASFLPEISSKIFKIKHQPIERPINLAKLTQMLKKAGLRVIFKGVWTLPVNYGRPIKFLPKFKNIPSCWFVISIKK
jgi:SAM-dependent methyltransferase